MGSGEYDQNSNKHRSELKKKFKIMLPARKADFPLQYIARIRVSEAEENTREDGKEKRTLPFDLKR